MQQHDGLTAVRSGFDVSDVEHARVDLLQFVEHGRPLHSLSAKREAQRGGAGIEELDLEEPVGDVAALVE